MRWERNFKLIISLLALSLVASCVFTSKKNTYSGPLPVPENYTKRTVKQITKAGINLRPHLSASGKRLLFVSANRTTHKNYQAYEKNLETQVEKRLTYQNGDVFEVHFSNNENRFVYSSSTDELKENPPFIENSLLAMKGKNSNSNTLKDDLGLILPRTEIYRTSLDSSSIDRVTNEPNFDGDISIRGKRHELVFVRWTNKVPSVYILNMKTENTSKVGVSGTWASDPAYSSNGEELAWVEKEGSNWILLTGSAYGKNGKLRHQSQNRIRDIVWSAKDDELFFSEVLEGNNAEIFALQLASGCKRQITYHTALDFHPYPSDDLSKLYFTSDRTGRFQIHEVGLEGLPPCANSKPTIE